jgi:hypothetical protein
MSVGTGFDVGVPQASYVGTAAGLEPLAAVTHLGSVTALRQFGFGAAKTGRMLLTRHRW